MYFNLLLVHAGFTLSILSWSESAASSYSVDSESDVELVDLYETFYESAASSYSVDSESDVELADLYETFYESFCSAASFD